MHTIVPQCKSSKLWLKMGSHWVLIDCILVEINKTKLSTFDLKEKCALQNNLLQFLKYLAESLDILKTQEIMES